MEGILPVRPALSLFMGRTPVPWTSIGEWAADIMRRRGYTHWEMSLSGTGAWFYPNLRYPDHGDRNRDFWKLPKALEEPKDE